MILRRIEVRNFRKLVGPIIVDGLGSGLSIVAGDNEEGKSTLLDCIRTAFFVKHNVTGDLPVSFQPYNSNVRPEIRIDFELNGQRYSLFKAFCQRPEVQLATATARFSGQAAEEELSRLLRFSLPKRMRKDEQREHEGVFGMFWVEQGESVTFDTNAAGRTSIIEALQKEVGDVLGGKRGQHLLSEVARLRESLLTSTGRPRGAYAQAEQDVAKVQTEVLRVDEVLRAHERSTEELQSCRSKLARYARERAVDLARERLEAAQAANESIALLQREIQDAEKASQAAKGRHDLAAERLMQRKGLVEALASAEQCVQQLSSSLEVHKVRVSALRSKQETADQVVKDSMSAADSAEQALRRAEANERSSQLRTELERLRQNQAAALKHKHERDAGLGSASGIKVDKAAVAEIKRLEDAVTGARARVEAVATEVCVNVAPGSNVLLDDQPIRTAQVLKVTRPINIRVPDFIEVAIRPGGEVRDPHLHLDEARRVLKETLRRFEVESLFEAENLLEVRTAALNQAQTSAKLIAAHAPNGLDKLDEQIIIVESELERVSAIARAAGTTLEEIMEDLPHLRAGRNVALQQLEDGRRRAEQSRRELADAERAETEATTKYAVEKEHCADRQRQLDAARKDVTDADLDLVVLAAAQEAKTAEATLMASRNALQASDPESVARRLQMAEATYREIKADLERLQEKAIRMESELRVSGALGLGERKHELQAELVAAEAELTRMERQARTADLLWRVLVDAETAAKEQFVRPVTERVQPYLRLLLPGTDLAFDEDIRIVGLRRGSTVEPFQSLSVGTQEQLAVLTRLAFADLLREHGQPAAVLLDDAIVFADDDRFERMLHVLHKAGEHLQIIVLTCRERDYRAAGAPIMRLSDCVAKATVGMHAT